MNLLYFGYLIAVNVLWLFLMVSWVGLQFVIELFPDDTHLRYALNCTFTYNNITPATNLGYRASTPQDNFSWVPNCSLGPPGCETKVS